MDVVEPLLSVDALICWRRVPVCAQAAAEKLAATRSALGRRLAGVYTSVPLGVWWQPEQNKAALEVPAGATAQDRALVKAAVSRVAEVAEVPGEPLRQGWIKLAYSPALTTLSEWLNFFPLHDAAGRVYNSPGPVQSMLTTGLLGAGLGYGGGWLAERMMPKRWKRGRLSTTLAALGAAAGMAPGAYWGMTNLRSGRRFNDPSVLYEPRLPSQPPAMEEISNYYQPKWQLNKVLPGPLNVKGSADVLIDAAVSVGQDPVAELVKAAEELDERNPFRRVPPSWQGPMAVNVSVLNRALWDNGASPQTAGMTLGVLGAAQQLPGGIGPGWVTPVQMGELAARMGAGYVSGALVGGALGLLTGMPSETQETLRRTGMYVGLIRALVPKMFGA